MLTSLPASDLPSYDQDNTVDGLGCLRTGTLSVHMLYQLYQLYQYYSRHFTSWLPMDKTCLQLTVPPTAHQEREHFLTLCFNLS